MPKRPYERRDGLLRDKVHDEEHVGPAFAVGELPSPEERAELLEKMRSGTAVERTWATYRIQLDRSKDFRDALLDGLMADNSMAPGLLARRFADHPRVRRGLLRAMRTCPVDSSVFVNLLQVIHMVGGASAVAAVEERLAELAEAAVAGPRSGRLVLRAAAALVRLDPTHPTGLAILREILADESHPLHREAFLDVVSACSKGGGDPVPEPLVSLLDRWLDTEDPSLALDLAPVLRSVRPETALARCLRAIASPDPNIRGRAAGVLVDWPSPLPDAADAAVRTWLAEQNGDPKCQYIAWKLRATEALTAIARRALASESPSDRSTGVATLGLIDPEVARAIAAEAISDEPDPGLRRQLLRWVQRPRT